MRKRKLAAHVVTARAFTREAGFVVANKLLDAAFRVDGHLRRQRPDRDGRARRAARATPEGAGRRVRGRP
jgi:hypothetical protein